MLVDQVMYIFVNDFVQRDVGVWGADCSARKARLRFQGRAERLLGRHEARGKRRGHGGSLPSRFPAATARRIPVVHTFDVMSVRGEAERLGGMVGTELTGMSG